MNAIKIYREAYHKAANNEITFDEYIDIILPLEDVRENIHGEWKECDATSPDYEYCSVCKWSNDVGARHYRFCPHCGADMRERRESE